MATQSNTTNITPPRVPFLDPATGLISREWYRFFLNLFVLTGSGTSQTSIVDLEQAPVDSSAELYAQLLQSLDGLGSSPVDCQVAGEALTSAPAATNLKAVNDRLEALEALPGFESYLANSTAISTVVADSPLAGAGTSASHLAIPAATASVDGYLSHIDWGTFNGKQPAGSYLTSVTADAPLSGSGTSGSHLTIPVATSSVSGYLSSTDWATFNGKGSGTVTAVSGTAPVVSSGGTAPAISMAAATGSVDGYLSHTDWTTFNNKGSGTVTSVSGAAGRITSTGGTTPTLDLASGIATPGTTGSSTLVPVVTIDTYGRITSITTAANPQGTVTSVTGTAPVVSSGGVTPAISMAAATTSVSGYLTSTDWNTFNGKQPAGSYLTANQTITLGGVLSGSGTTSIPAAFASTPWTGNGINGTASGLYGNPAISVAGNTGSGPGNTGIYSTSAVAWAAQFNSSYASPTSIGVLGISRGGTLKGYLGTSPADNIALIDGTSGLARVEALNGGAGVTGTLAVSSYVGSANLYPNISTAAAPSTTDNYGGFFYGMTAGGYARVGIGSGTGTPNYNGWLQCTNGATVLGFSINPLGGQVLVGTGGLTTTCTTDATSTTAAALTTAGGLGVAKTIYAGTGINLGGTTLTHYDEGTWTPAITFGGGNTGLTHGVQVGTYTRIGDRVFFQGRVTLTNKGSSTGAIAITGLFYPTNATANHHGAYSAQLNNVSATVTAIYAGYSPNQTQLFLYQIVAGTSANITDADCTNTTVVNFSGHYQI